MRINSVLAKLLISVFLLSMHLCTQAEEKTIVGDDALELVSQTDQLTPVQYLHREPLIYPVLLRNTGNKGHVVSMVTLNTLGGVDAINVVESSHPAFEQAAVKSLLKWTFVPATRNSIPISTKVLVPIKFSLDYTYDGGVLPYSFPDKKKAQLPTDLQYDSSPIVKIVAPVVYPLDLLSKDISGSAKVSVLVDPEGDVHEVKILEATHPAFGMATRAMMESWTFTPATKNGQPTWGLFVRTQQFSKDERDTFLDANALLLLKQSRAANSKVYKLNQLDAIPKALYQPLPSYPNKLKQDKVTDRVMVEFFIDRDGMVQLPQILKSESDELAWLAMTAVLRWQFEPPKKNGKPVSAVVSVPVNFN